MLKETSYFCEYLILCSNTFVNSVFNTLLRYTCEYWGTCLKVPPQTDPRAFKLPLEPVCPTQHPYNVFHLCSKQKFGKIVFNFLTRLWRQHMRTEPLSFLLATVCTLPGILPSIYERAFSRCQGTNPLTIAHEHHSCFMYEIFSWCNFVCTNKNK